MNSTQNNAPIKEGNLWNLGKNGKTTICCDEIMWLIVRIYFHCAKIILLYLSFV